jgi:hypothetical protein
LATDLSATISVDLAFGKYKALSSQIYPLSSNKLCLLYEIARGELSETVAYPGMDSSAPDVLRNKTVSILENAIEPYIFGGRRMKYNRR